VGRSRPALRRPSRGVSVTLVRPHGRLGARPCTLRREGTVALLPNVVVRWPGEPEVYAATAELHDGYCPRNPNWGHPPPGCAGTRTLGVVNILASARLEGYPRRV